MQKVREEGGKDEHDLVLVTKDNGTIKKGKGIFEDMCSRLCRI